MKKIFILIFLCLSVSSQDVEFPSDHSIKTRMFDTINMFIDSQNQLLFQLHSFFQAQFDSAVATLWLYYRSVSLYANTRGFATAALNRSDLAECISSLDDVMAKVIDHLDNQVMRAIFDVRHSVTQIEIHLNSQLDQLKDTIIKSPNIACLGRVPLTDASITAAYRPFTQFLQRGFQDANTRTFADYNARFGSDLSFAVRQMISLRSSIMTARSRDQLVSFIENFCKPFVFHRFENLIDTSNDVVQGLFRKIHDTLDEAASKLPYDPPFFFQLQSCLH